MWLMSYYSTVVSSCPQRRNCSWTWIGWNFIMCFKEFTNDLRRWFFFFRWTLFIMILISIVSWFICSQQLYGFGTIIKSNILYLPVFNLCYRVRSFIRFGGKDTQQMMIPGSLRFTLRTVRKFFLNLGRKLQITKLNQWRKISRYSILSHSDFFLI